MKLDFNNHDIYTHALKMKKLVEHSDALIQADKDRKENSNNI